MLHNFLKIDFQWLANFWRQRRGLMLVVLILTVISIGVRTTYPLMFKFVLDKLTIGADTSTIRNWVLLLIGVGFLQSIMFAALPNSRAYGNLVFGKLMREQVFRKVLRKGYDFFLKFRTGDVITRLTDDIEGGDLKLAWYSCSGIMRPIEMSLVILFSLIVMFSLNWKLTLLIFIPLPIFIWLLAKTMKEMEEKAIKRQEAIGHVNDLLETSFSGIRIVKGFCSERAFGEMLSKTLENRIQSEVGFIRINAKVEAVGSLVNNFGVIIALFVGGIFTIRGEMSVGSFFAFANYFQFLVEPFFTIGYFFAMTKVNSAYIDRLKEVEEYPPLRSDGTLSAPPLETLEVKNLTLGYAENPVLKNVSFQVQRGRILALVGPIGSGKTTMLEGLLGELKPIEGEITWNGMNIDSISYKTRMEKIGYVPQESLLFSTSIYENVRLGDETVTSDVIYKSLHTVQLQDEIQKFPEQEHTFIGQRGVELSGGQKQRLSLARALAQRPELLLLDDVTSALDAETEFKFWLQFRDHYPSTTVVVVTHRLATAAISDEVIMLDEGKIVAKGHHTDLLESNARYQRFVEQEEEEEIIQSYST